MTAVAAPSASAVPRRFPLIARVIGWLLLNLLLLATVAFLAAQHYLGNGYEALLAGGAADRVRALGKLIVQEMLTQPRSNWDQILDRFGKAYNLKLYAFSDTGIQIGGEAVVLPAAVQARLTKEPRRPPNGRDRRPGMPPPGGDPLGFGPGGPEGRPPRPEDGRPFDDRRPEPGYEGPENGDPQRPPPPPPPPPAGFEPRSPMIHGFLHAGEPKAWWVLARVDLQPLPPNGPMTLVMASSTLSGDGLLLDFGPALRIGGVALALSILFWIPLVRGITGSIAKLRNATAEIAVGKFDIRVNDRRGDEIGELGGAINSMAERLAGLMSGQRRFLSDVAHELCAPLSRLQVALGILEERARGAALPPEQLQVRLGDLREEVDHMAGLVNELLSFSRAALGTNQAKLKTIELVSVIESAARREVVEGGEILVECPPHLRATADADLLARAIGNLVRNSIRYAGHAGSVRISAVPNSDGVRITVADQGPGVPADALPQLFDPFYRVDTARTRESGGVGLGLTIARTCVEACGGSIRARNRDQGGLEVEIALNS